MIEYPPKQYVTQNLMEREVRKGLTKCVEDVYKKRKLHSLTFLLFRFNFFDNTCFNSLCCNYMYSVHSLYNFVLFKIYFRFQFFSRYSV